jgi:hypothetical protein
MDACLTSVKYWSNTVKEIPMMIIIVVVAVVVNLHETITESHPLHFGAAGGNSKHHSDWLCAE